MKSYKERLWRKLRYFKDEYISEKQKSDIEARLKDVEIYETCLSYLEDAMNICNTKSFGFWRSHTFSRVVDLSAIDFNKSGNKVIYSPQKYEDLNLVLEGDNEDESTLILKLSVWLQLTRSLKAGSTKKYIKVQVENTSTPFTEDANHYFSIVTERVNERCIFGINIRVDSEFLTPYQEIRGGIHQDDVERLNYLYRSIKDYAVGHSCSVDWCVNEREKWVRTEFIPSFETPDVEAVPRDKYDYQVTNGHSIPRQLLANSKALEFKWLSTLSDASDEEIIEQLKVFVDSYRDWIIKQKQILNQSSDDNHIGYENLELCQADCDRMASNIKYILE